jgi:hypothetical protein
MKLTKTRRGFRIGYLAAEQTCEPGERALGAEVAAHCDGQCFQGDAPGKLIIDCCPCRKPNTTGEKQRIG